MEAIRPGDVVLRAYDDYLDGHSGICIGDNQIVHSIAESSALIDGARTQSGARQVHSAFDSPTFTSLKVPPACGICS